MPGREEQGEVRDLRHRPAVRVQDLLLFAGVAYRQALITLAPIIAVQIVGNLVRHMMRLPTDFFEKRHVGDIFSRIGAVQPIQEAITKGVIAAIIDGVMAAPHHAIHPKTPNSGPVGAGVAESEAAAAALFFPDCSNRRNHASVQLLKMR